MKRQEHNATTARQYDSTTATRMSAMATNRNGNAMLVDHVEPLEAPAKAMK